MWLERRQVRLGYWCLCGVGFLTLALFLVSRSGFVASSLTLGRLGSPAVAAKLPSGPGAGSKTGPAMQARLVETYGRLPLTFEGNAGQTDAQVKFLSRGRGYTLFLTGNEAVLALGNGSRKSRVESRKVGTDVAQRFPHSGTAAFPGFLESPWRTLARLDLESPRGQTTDPPLRVQSLIPSPQPLTPSVVRLKLAGANPKAKVVGLDPLPGKSNYFLGNDPKKWRTNVLNYRKVRHKDVWPGIALVYYGKSSVVSGQLSVEAIAGPGLREQGQLEFDFVVAPGADPKAIGFEIVGATRRVARETVGARHGVPLRIDPSGALVISTAAGDVRFHKPVVYQPQSTVDSRGLTAKSPPPSAISTRHSSPESPVPRPGSSTTGNGPRATDAASSSPFAIHNSELVEGRFVMLASNRIGFEIGAYDKSKPLVIDPVLSYSTYLGGSEHEGARAVAVDADGNAYVVGQTPSIDFPTQDPFQHDSAGGGADIFVTKLTPGGSSLAYSTYVGGVSLDLARGIAVDSSGSAYVMGITSSWNFPTLNAYQPGRNGMYDVVVFKLDPTGSALLYSTYLGGSGREDPSDPRTGGIAVDSASNAYVTGTTDTDDFPTKNASQPTYAGGTCGTPPNNAFPCPDAFVAKFNTNLSGDESLVYSTYLGGSGRDKGFDIAVDPVGNAYVTGWATSANFPTTPGALQETYRGVANAFVAKFGPDGSRIYSTYLGGTDLGDRGEGIAVDAEGNAYVTGSADSTDFPTTTGAFQTKAKGGDCIWYICDDAFVSKLNPAGSALVYSTYLGSSGGDKGAAIAVDSEGNAYVTGPTGMSMANDFPMVNPIQPAHAGGTCGEPPDTFPCFNAYVAKLNAVGNALLFSTYLGTTGGENGDSIAVDPPGNIFVIGGTGSTDFPITPGAFQTSLQGPGDAFVVKIGPGDNTPAGSGVNVTLTNAVSLTFDSVSTSGTTGVTRTDTGPEPPAGFSLGHPPSYFELGTTAVFSGSVEVCINYTGTNYGNESKLKLFHFEGGKWEDRTVSLDTTNDIICASVTSLSPFAVLEDTRVEAEGLKPPLADLVLEGLPVPMPGIAFKQGSTLPLRLQLFRDGVALTNADVSPPQIADLLRNGEALDLAMMDLDAGQANDSGTLFRFSDSNWVYNLSTQGLSPGTYTITIRMPDGRRWDAGFVMR